MEVLGHSDWVIVTPFPWHEPALKLGFLPLRVSSLTAETQASARVIVFEPFAQTLTRLFLFHSETYTEGTAVSPLAPHC